MIKKVNNFLDGHRIILVLLILAIISAVFMIVNIYMFFNYKFVGLECIDKINQEVCLNNGKEILVNPEESKKTILKEYKESLANLKETYDLPEFNLYTAYYYTIASNLDYNKYERNEKLNTFLNQYTNTYDLEEFYKNNNLFYDLFMPYKLV